MGEETVTLHYDFAKAAWWIGWTLKLDGPTLFDTGAVLAPLALWWDVELRPGEPYLPDPSDADIRVDIAARQWQPLVAPTS